MKISVPNIPKVQEIFMPVSPQTLAGLQQGGVEENEELTDAQKTAISFRQTLDDTIAVLEGIGPLCTDIDELISMLDLARKNDSQLYLVMTHMAPKRMKLTK